MPTTRANPMELKDLKLHIPNQAQRQYVNIRDYYIMNGSALKVEFSDDDTVDNRTDEREPPSGGRRCSFYCCAARLHIIDTRNPSASKRIDERYLRMHRVSKQSYYSTLDDDDDSFHPRQADRLAYGDIVYLECGKGHVLRGKSITSKAKWNKRRNFDDKKSLKDTKCHFRITGNHTDGNVLTVGRSFQLQSVHWEDSYLGGVGPHQAASRENESSSDDARFDTLVIGNKARLDAKNAKILRFFAKPLAIQPPRKTSSKRQKRSLKCSHGYTKAAHRIVCQSYLNQSSSGGSTADYAGFSSAPADVDVIV